MTATVTPLPLVTCHACSTLSASSTQLLPLPDGRLGWGVQGEHDGGQHAYGGQHTFPWVQGGTLGGSARK